MSTEESESEYDEVEENPLCTVEQPSTSKVDKLHSVNNQIRAISLKLPPFWSKTPLAWFNQIEAQFQISNIKRDLLRYNYVISALPQHIAEEITDLINGCPGSGKYDYIKSSLINRYSLSVERRIKKIIADEEMGNRKPSDFYRALLRIAANDTDIMSQQMIKNIWLTRLPQLMSVVLIPLKDDDIDLLLKTADSIWENSNDNSSLLLSQNTATMHNDLLNEIKDLNFNLNSQVKQLTHLCSKNFLVNNDKVKPNIVSMQAVSNQVNSNQSKVEKSSAGNSNNFKKFTQPNKNNSQNSRTFCRNPNYSPNNQNFKQQQQDRQSHISSNSNKICFYHSTFGVKANKCRLPCLFSSLVNHLN